MRPKSEVRQELDDIMRTRSELLDSMQRELNRAGHHTCKLVIRIHKSIAASFAKHIAALDARAAALVAGDKDLAEADALMQAVSGVGPQTSRTLLAFLPELGHVGRGTIASLVGVAPYDRDSGKFKGKRFIRGGRGQIRKVLYMAALVAIRRNVVLKVIYKRLRDAGKIAKVAIVAVMRHLLIHLNSIMAKSLENPLAV